MSYGALKLPNNSNLRGYANKNFVQSMLPKIFEPPFGLTPKIPSCPLRLTKKELSKQNNKNNETSHRPTCVKRNFLLNAHKTRKLRSHGIFGGSKTLRRFAPRLATLGRATGGYVARLCSPKFALSGKLHISPKRCPKFLSHPSG